MSTWRSDIGKAGHQAVFDLFSSDPATFSSKEDHAAYVADALKGLRYIYGNPDSMVSVSSIAGKLSY
jgi:hypothetical protein